MRTRDWFWAAVATTVLALLPVVPFVVQEAAYALAGCPGGGPCKWGDVDLYAIALRYSGLGWFIVFTFLLMPVALTLWGVWFSRRRR